MSLPPQTASSEATAIAMSDLESGKKRASVTVVSVDSRERPVLGRRRTTNEKAGKVERNQTDHGIEEDALTKVGNFLWKVHTASVFARYGLYIIPVAALLAIPLVLTATVYHNAKAGNIRLLGLFIWIEILWVSLWICKLVAMSVPVVYGTPSSKLGLAIADSSHIKAFRLCAVS